MLPGTQTSIGPLRDMAWHRVAGQIANVAEKGEQVIEHREGLPACGFRKRSGERPPTVILQSIGAVISGYPALRRHGLPEKNQKLGQFIRAQITQCHLFLDSAPE